MPALRTLFSTALPGLLLVGCVAAPRAQSPPPIAVVDTEPEPILPLPAPEPEEATEVIRLPPPAPLSAKPPRGLQAAQRQLHGALIQGRLATASPGEDERIDRRQRRLARKRDIPIGELRVVVGGKRHEIVLYDATGRMRPEGWGELDALISPSHAPLSPRLAALLYMLCRDTDRPVHVFNPSEVDAAHRHARGDALDLYIDGLSAERLRDHIQRRFERVGVGLQLATRLVHVDLRERPLYWTDFSRSGRAGVERFEAPEDTPEQGSDPTLASPHLALAQLYPRDHPLKASEKTEEAPSRRSRRKYHKVKKGETLSEIAARYDVSVKKLVRMNKLKDAALIRRGQKLRVR